MKANTQDSLENGESKREIFTKLTQVNIFMVETFYDLYLRVSNVY